MAEEPQDAGKNEEEPPNSISELPDGIPDLLTRKKISGNEMLQLVRWMYGYSKDNFDDSIEEATEYLVKKHRAIPGRMKYVRSNLHKLLSAAINT